MNKSENKTRHIVSLLFKYGVPLAVSIGLCIMLFRDFDLTEMWQTIRTECDFRPMLLVLVITVFSHVFRAMRWQIQLKALGIDAPLFTLVLSIFGTYAVNLIFPRRGEVWRTGYIANRQQTQFSTVFGSMVAERVADTFTVLLLTLLAFVLASNTLIAYLAQSEETYNAIIGMISSPLFWILLIACCLIFWRLLKRRANSPFIQRIKKFVGGLWSGFAVVASMPGKARWLLLTVGVWGCYFLQLFVAFFAFDFTAEVFHQHGIEAVLVTFVLSSISMGVPSNGGIGPWQWAVIFALGMYGLNAAPAATFANLVLGCNTLFLIALGLFTCVAVAIGRRRSAKSETNKLIQE